ncbi:MAG: hypothetical protein DMG73_15575 [Acidobacteria bacterium]|nr:MAG: hypothetical protein DMG73_15575 [Acidobacteriota bacterium]
MPPISSFKNAVASTGLRLQLKICGLKVERLTIFHSISVEAVSLRTLLAPWNLAVDPMRASKYPETLSSAVASFPR